MSASNVIHEFLTRDSRVVLPRVGGGVGEGGEVVLIHASSPTSRTSSPVDNATAAATTDRDAWMDLRWIGGGW